MTLLVTPALPVLSTTVICGRHHPSHVGSLLPDFNSKASYKIQNTLVYEMPTLFQKRGANNFRK